MSCVNSSPRWKIHRYYGPDSARGPLEVGRSMRISLIGTLALLLCACGSKSGPESAGPTPAAPVSARPSINDDAVAAVLESQGKPLVELRFVLESRPVAGQAFPLQLVASSKEPVLPLQLTTESDALKVDPSTAVLALSATGSGSTASYGATREFTVTSAQEGLAELTVHLVVDQDTPEMVYVIPVMVDKPAAAAPSGGPPSGKPDPAAQGDHAEPQNG